jgi:hypothetical protein
MAGTGLEDKDVIISAHSILTQAKKGRTKKAKQDALP